MRLAVLAMRSDPAMLAERTDPSEQDVHVAGAVQALRGQGHDIRVYPRAELSGDRLPPPGRELTALISAFTRRLSSGWQDSGWQPDVLHAFDWPSGLAALSLRARLGVPVVQTFHGLGSGHQRLAPATDQRAARWIGYERLVGRLADAVVAHGADEAAELAALGVAKAVLVQVPPGIDTDTFAPEGSTVDRPHGVPRILSAGGLGPAKGAADLVAALPRVPGAELVLLGGPPDGQVRDDPAARALRQAAELAGVADRVVLAGGVPHKRLPDWYRSADVLACPSRYEPFGLPALEAMACGVPVVGYQVGGLTDTVVDGYTGDLVPPRDVRALGDALRRLLGDPVRRMRYSAAGTDRVRQSFTWARAAAQLAGVYTGLLRRRRSRPDSGSGSA